MALLRYTLRDFSEKKQVDVNMDWIEETYYGPIRVVNGYCEATDPVIVLTLCQRGYEVVSERNDVSVTRTSVEGKSVDSPSEEELAAEDDEQKDEEESEEKAPAAPQPRSRRRASLGAE